MRNPIEEAQVLERIAGTARGGIDPQMARGLSQEVYSLNHVLKLMPENVKSEAIAQMNIQFDQNWRNPEAKEVGNSGSAVDRRKLIRQDIPVMHMEADGSLTVIGTDSEQTPTTLKILPSGQVNDYECGRMVVAVPPIG